MSDKIVSIEPGQARRVAKELRDAGYDPEDADLGLRVDAETGEILDPDTGAPTGRTLEQLAAEEPFFPVLEGSQPQLTLDVGGRRPDGSVLVIGRSLVPLTGQYPRRGRVRLKLELEIDDVTFKSVKDPTTGNEIACDRIHVARVVPGTVEDA